MADFAGELCSRGKSEQRFLPKPVQPLTYFQKVFRQNTLFFMSVGSIDVKKKELLAGLFLEFYCYMMIYRLSYQKAV